MPALAEVTAPRFNVLLVALTAARYADLFDSLLARGLAFLVVGAIPLISYLVNLAFPGAIPDAFLVSIVLTAAAFLLVGALKAAVVGQGVVRGSIETVVLGGIAAGLAFVVGRLLEGIA